MDMSQFAEVKGLLRGFESSSTSPTWISMSKHRWKAKFALTPLHTRFSSTYTVFSPVLRETEVGACASENCCLLGMEEVVGWLQKKYARWFNSRSFGWFSLAVCERLEAFALTEGVPISPAVFSSPAEVQRRSFQ
ncbi:unnamed protein product [Leuciscus chuanchicus]